MSLVAHELKFREIWKIWVHITLIIEITNVITPVLTFSHIIFPYALSSPFTSFRFLFPFHCHCCFTYLHSLLKIHSLHCVRGAIFVSRVAFLLSLVHIPFFVSRGSIFVSSHRFCGSFTPSLPSLVWLEFVWLHLHSLVLFFFPIFTSPLVCLYIYMRYVLCIFEMLYLYV